MLKSIGKLLLHLATGATVATVLLLWASAFSAHIPPEEHGWLNVLGLCFPIFAAGNLLALASWLVVRSRRALIPLAGFVCCISDVQAYSPVNIPQPAPKGCLKVMSYNVMNFAFKPGEPLNGERVVNYITSSGADVVCLQESSCYSGWDDIEKRLRTKFPYIGTLYEGSGLSVLRCLSRYPITGKTELPLVSKTNCAGVFDISLEKGDTLHVVNCHLQSDNLTQTERSNYENIVTGKQQHGAKSTIFTLMSKLSKAAQIRSTQTDTIMKYVRAHKDEPTIVCGDFNDSPISYTRREMATVLTDAYKASGIGPGFSFNHNGMFVRIDHILCSSHWKPYEATVDHTVNNSDHYPIYVFLKRKAK